MFGNVSSIDKDIIEITHINIKTWSSSTIYNCLCIFFLLNLFVNNWAAFYVYLRLDDNRGILYGHATEVTKIVLWFSSYKPVEAVCLFFMWRQKGFESWTSKSYFNYWCFRSWITTIIYTWYLQIISFPLMKCEAITIF